MSRLAAVLARCSSSLVSWLAGRSLAVYLASTDNKTPAVRRTPPPPSRTVSFCYSNYKRTLPPANYTCIIALDSFSVAVSVYTHTHHAFVSILKIKGKLKQQNQTLQASIEEAPDWEWCDSRALTQLTRPGPIPLAEAWPG